MMNGYLLWLSDDGWLPSVIDIIAKSSLFLVLAATACWLLRRRDAAFRHRDWAFAVGGCGLMPLIATVGPQVRVPVLSQQASDQEVSRSFSPPTMAHFDVPVDKNRRVVAISHDGKFGVSASIQAIDASVHTIKMQPTASLRFRLIDQASDEPLPGFQFKLRYGNETSPTRGPWFYGKSFYVADKDGVVTIPSVIPGQPFSVVVDKEPKLPNGSSKGAPGIQLPKQLDQLALQPSERRNLDTVNAIIGPAQRGANLKTEDQTEVLVRTTAKPTSRFLPVYTLTEILDQNHAAVIARKSSSEEATLKDADHALFEISDVLKGQRPLEGSIVDARMLAGEMQGELFLLVGKRSTSKHEMHWRVAKTATAAYREHALAVTKLQHADAQRLAYFQPLLEHPDQTVSANAHMEWVVASDDAFTSACERLDRTKIRQWLADPNMAADRYRLYLAMLARCGNSIDAEWLYQKTTAKVSPTSLIATLGCYLALTGEAGLRVRNTRYIDNPNATYIEQYSAIQALRFVSTLPSEPVSQKSIIESYRLLLSNSGIADLVIPELARLKDWDSLDRLVELFQEPDNGWTPVPIVNFVRACPNAYAKERLQELRKLDPNTVRRAETFFPVLDTSKARVSLRRTYGRNGSGC